MKDFTDDACGLERTNGLNASYPVDEIANIKRGPILYPQSFVYASAKQQNPHAKNVAAERVPVEAIKSATLMRK